MLVSSNKGEISSSASISRDSADFLISGYFELRQLPFYDRWVHTEDSFITPKIRRLCISRFWFSPFSSLSNAKVVLRSGGRAAPALPCRRRDQRKESNARGTLKSPPSNREYEIRAPPFLCYAHLNFAIFSPPHFAFIKICPLCVSLSLSEK